MNAPRRAAALGLSLLLGACASQPPVRERSLELELPAGFSGADVDGAASTDAGTHGTHAAPQGADWWRAFAPDALAALIEEALANNPDLAAVATRLEAAGARLDVQDADTRPSASLGLARDRTKRNFIGFPTPGGSGDATTTSRATSYRLSLDTAWEIDLFGRLGAEVDAAVADLQAAQADLEGARLSLTGAVLKAAFRTVEARGQTELAEASLAAWERDVAVVQRRYEAGLRSALDLRRISASRAQAASEAEAARRTARDAARQLERLLGRAPGAAFDALAALPTVPPEPPPGLPVELLGRRPDLAAAERRLLAEERRVAARRAELYPRFSLTGSVGTSSEDIDDLLDGDFGVWSFGANLVLPLFEGGRLRARVVEAESSAAQALLGFTGALLDALAEVERDLDAGRSLADELVDRAGAAEDSARAAELARERYRNGVGDLLDLLAAQRSAVIDESTRLSVQRRLLESRVDLHLALGGGFDASSLDPETVP